MTLEQWKDLQNRIIEKTGYIRLPMLERINSIMVDLCSGITDYYRADIAIHKVRALCDMSIIAIKELDVDYETLRSKKLIKMDKLAFIRAIGLVGNFISALGEEHQYVSLSQFLYSFMKKIESEVNELGYNFYAAMIETINAGPTKSADYSNCKIY